MKSGADALPHFNFHFDAHVADPQFQTEPSSHGRCGLSMTAVWILIKWRLPESKRLDGLVICPADGKRSLPESMRRRHIERLQMTLPAAPAADVVGNDRSNSKRKKMAELTSAGAGDGAQSGGAFAALAAAVTTQTRSSRRLLLVHVVIDAYHLHGGGRHH